MHILLIEDDERLINFLERLSPKYGSSIYLNNQHLIELNLKISQEQMADFIGASRESINRKFKQLKQARLIFFQGHHVLLNPAIFRKDVFKRKS